MRHQSYPANLKQQERQLGVHGGYDTRPLLADSGHADVRFRSVAVRRVSK